MRKSMVLKSFIKGLLLLVVILSFSFSGMTQTVRGRVLDKKGEAVIGATIVVKRLVVGTVAGVDGYYELKVKGGLLPKDTLIFTSVGFKTKNLFIRFPLLSLRIGRCRTSREVFRVLFLI